MQNTIITQAMEYVQQGKVLFSLDKYAEAIEMYKKAEVEDPMFLEVYLAAGEAYVMLEDYNSARESFNKVLILDKKNAATYFHMGNIEFLCDNYDLGREHYAQAVNYGFEDVQLYVNLGFLADEVGNTEDAIKYYNRAISRDKFRADARVNKAQIYMRERKLELALQTLDELIQYNPDVFEGHHYKFIVLVEQKNYAEAEIALEKALSMFPDDEGFLFDKVVLYEGCRRYDDALEVLNTRFPDSKQREVLLERAKIFVAMDKTDEGTVLFEQLLHAAQTIDTEVAFYLCSIYLTGKNYEKTLKLCDEVIRDQKEDSFYYTCLYYKPFALEKLGKTAQSAEYYSSAIVEYRKAYSGDSSMLDLVVYRVLCHKALKEYDKALELIQYLLAVNEDFAEAYLIRSEIYTELHEPEKAEADKQMAMTRNKMIQGIMSL